MSRVVSRYLRRLMCAADWGALSSEEEEGGATSDDMLNRFEVLSISGLL